MKNNLAVMGFILLSGLAKLAFHRAHVISSKVPESCLLVILGVLFGGLLYPFYKDECSDNQKCLDYDDLGMSVCHTVKSVITHISCGVNL